MDKQPRKHRIKSMKPHKNSFFHQGYVDLSTCNKVFDEVRNQPVIYRSGLELQFIKFFENCAQITNWASEPFNIEYYSRLDKKMKNYYPDFIIETKTGQPIIVEIKPYAQTQKPTYGDSDWNKEAWIRNTDKWNAAIKFAHDRGMKFVILTEKFFDDNGRSLLKK
jgi:hypothetical protein